MGDIYRQQTGLTQINSLSWQGAPQHVSSSSIRRRSAPLPQGFSANNPAVNAAYTATAQNQINSEFKVLPNANVPIYVFPHLSHFSGTDVPVPGYTTSFFLYNKNHYAMPGEEY